LEEEAPTRNDTDLKLTEGKIEFRHVTLKYKAETDDIAVRDISFVVNPSEKIGIVGQTGSGKSSIMVCLFRLTELTKGNIFIDGQDISKVGLHSLRRQISVIPQFPFIFTASLKYNLDPMDEHTEEAIWEALDHANLKKHFEKDENGLEQELSSAIISAGQK
jgi:ABC-type multidrug transport system fused ATPase/permease subunit